MGEAKNKQRNKTPQERLADELAKEFANRGQLIEAGWVALRTMWVPEDASEQQVRDMRWAFMAGAQHLFGSIMSTLDEDKEPTEADLKRMDLIDAELKRFSDEVKLYTSRAQGSA